MVERRDVSVATAHMGLTGNIVFLNREPYEREGLRVRLICPGTGRAIVEALLRGEADYTNVLAGPIMAAVGGAPLKFILDYQHRGWELWARPEIMTVSDLVGKTMAQTSPLAEKYLYAALQRYGVDPHVVRAGQPVFSPQGILAGEVDAALLLAPMTAEAERVGLRRLLGAAEVGDPPTYGLMTTNERLQNRPDELRRMIRATLNSVKQLMGDPALGFALVEELGTPEEVAEAALGATVGYLNPTGEISAEIQQRWIEIAREATGVQHSVPLAQVFDFHILHDVRSG